MKISINIPNGLFIRAWLLAALFIAAGTVGSFAETDGEQDSSRTKLLKEKYGLHEETIRTLEEINRAASRATENIGSPKTSTRSKPQSTSTVPSAGSKTSKSSTRQPAASSYPKYAPYRTTRPMEKKKEKGFFGRLFSKDDDKETDYKKKAAEEARRLKERRAEQEQIRKKIEAARKAREARLAKAVSSKSTSKVMPSRPAKAILPPPARATTSPTFPNINAPGEPLLRPGLIIAISVYNHGELEGKPSQHRIPSDGNITLPLVGTTNVSGITLEQLGKRLTDKYRSFLKNPQVTAQFVADRKDEATMPWGYVTVLGRVKKPGRIYLPASRSIPLSTAIQSAGGFATSAKTKAIKITRKRLDGKLDKTIKNLQKVSEDGQVDDMDLKPNDVVYVPVRIF